METFQSEIRPVTLLYASLMPEQRRWANPNGGGVGGWGVITSPCLVASQPPCDPGKKTSITRGKPVEANSRSQKQGEQPLKQTSDPAAYLFN